MLVELSTKSKGAQGFAMVDDEDFDRVSKRNWYLTNGYAVSNDGDLVKMHRLILNASTDAIIDHIDRNQINNQKSNLRIVNREENVHNQKKRTGTFNNYKGTLYIPRLKLWLSRCRMYKQDFHLGYFKTEIAAAIAYNKKASELSPGFILLNEINLSDEEQAEILLRERSCILPAEKRSSHHNIYWNKKAQKWDVRIRLNNKYKQIGSFSSEEEAFEARKRALMQLKK